MPKRVITQSRQLPNQYSAERLNTMIVDLQNKRTQLLTKYRADDRLVREVDEQIKTTRDALNRAEQKTSVEEATDLNPLRQTLETELSRARLDQAGAKARRDTLASQLGQYDASLKKLEGDTAKHDDLQRTKKEAEDNYQLYAKKREEARIADELDRQKITNVSIAETATVPQLPSSPNRPLNLLLGIVLAGFLSLGTVFSAEMLSDAVDTPRQLEALTGAMVLATVPEKSRRILLRDMRAAKTIEQQPQAKLLN
jgi:succinoglycan biosynthesis transport protein ExoP